MGIKDAIVEIGDVRKGSSRPAITKHLLAKYPDIDGEKSRIYLRNAFRRGLKTEALVLARKEGKGAGSYKIAKVTSEKPKDVVKKKSEAPKKVAKKPVDKAVKSPAAKKSAKGSAAKPGKSPAKPTKKVGKSPAAKKAAAKKATAKSPIAKKAAKK